MRGEQLALRSLRDFHFEDGEFISDKKGLFGSQLTLGDMKDLFCQVMVDQEEWKQANGGSAYREKDVCLDPNNKFGKIFKESGERETHYLTIVVSMHGVLITMYPIVPNI
ncbi:MAG TPA: hypothetical protein VN520_03395 [Streptomyces sp.]|uniref:hypothetical protein n=1 Tax=Streptomyces sp. TaxID=1931 RepID=UPI002C91FB02|nr:hypothetical protein [Streptomyces sp.]HWU05441.1 hypothetical protein [Streptomyces sp.]